MPTPKTKKVSDIRTASRRAAEPKPEPPQPPAATLTPIQETLADLLGDIIRHGAFDDELDGIIWNAMTHSWRLMFGSNRTNWTPEKVTEDANTFARNNFDDWKRSLIQSWTTSAKGKPVAEPKPNTVTEYIRANYRDRLKFRFEEFLGKAAAEEIRFMEDVLLDYDSMTTSSWEPDGLEIANSFEREIDRDVRWVKVPVGMHDKVLDFVEMITPKVSEAA